MYPESDDLSEYLVSDAIVDWQTPAVREKALELTRSLSDEASKARCLYEWVRDTISHSSDTGLDIVTCTASEVLHHGTGICFAKSHLLAALLRAVDIPAGFCYQVLRLDPPVDNEPVLHGATPTGSTLNSALRKSSLPLPWTLWPMNSSTKQFLRHR